MITHARSEEERFPAASHTRPKRPPNFFQFFALNEVAEK